MAFLATIGAGLLGLTGTAATGIGATLAGGTALATAGLGIATGVKSLLSSSKGAKDTQQVKSPKAPTEEDAQSKAAASVAKRRRISLLSGGETNITRGKALVPEENLGRKTLLGS